jgi:DNA-binding NarL/FixJ family response regulator
MSFWRRLLRTLGFRSPVPRIFHLDDDLSRSLQALAEREQRTQEQVAADMISDAIIQHDFAQEKLLRWRSLTPREQQITALICQKYTTGQIAKYLVVSPSTVKSHVSRILVKFEVHSRGELRMLLEEWDFSDLH